MLVKLDDAAAALIGADATNFAVKFSAFVNAAKQMETAMANQPDFAAIELRIKALETAAPGITEARVKELINAESAVPIKTFIASDEGKKLIGAEASRIVMEASAATGTVLAKPSPASAVPAAAEVSSMISAGNFAGAYAASKELQSEFPDAKCYEAYAKAEAQGRIRFNVPREKSPANN